LYAYLSYFSALVFYLARHLDSLNALNELHSDNHGLHSQIPELGPWWSFYCWSEWCSESVKTW